ncbi:MAG: LLM class flavin-dependent oxidoreductase [Chloroflexota bacterium]|nr:LLM class flavin-dependent oxidoreductase [Chloroflexota bacterium]
MHLGLFMMPLHPPTRPPFETYDEDLELIRRADKLGFTEIWIGEHMSLPWENIPNPELFIARALSETDNIVFGTGVVLLPLRNPVMVAHNIAMLDHLAKGRLMFGIGSGGTPNDAEMLGINHDSAEFRERTSESIHIITKLWKEGPFDYEGTYYKVGKPQNRPELEMSFHMTPYQTPHPPIAVAGGSIRSKTLELAGEKGWIPLSPSLVHRSHLEHNWQSIEKGAHKNGLKPSRNDWRVGKQVYVANTTEQAKREALSGAMARDFTDYWSKLIGNSPAGLDTFKIDPETPDEEITPEYLLENFWIVGDPDYCISEIEKLHKESGGFGTLLIQTDDWGNNNSQFFNSMELMAKEVMPAIKDL